MVICMDVTETVNVDFVSGIQRVVLEITTHWIRDAKDIILLSYDYKRHNYRVLDNLKYYEYYTGKSRKKDFFTNRRMNLDDFNSNYIFFDIDSVWMSFMKRSHLLPLLKSRGVKIAALIYDVIPITDTQYADNLTSVNFIEYIGAELQYADVIIVNTQATLNAIYGLIKDTNVISVNGKVVRLGEDIKKKSSEPVSETVQEIVAAGKYILMVGTLEPRKNHNYVLDAFDESLFKEGINLVFAGRIGWNVDNLVNRIKTHKEFNRHLFLINNASDADIVYLYEHAMVFAFPSFNEGFGLPIVEAFDRETMVLAADIPVLREIGGDYCKYFSLKNSGEFITLVKDYLEHPQKLEADREKVKKYKKTSWAESANLLYNVLQDKRQNSRPF